jgi:isopenicillin-N N-acyltransferase like protein
MKVFTYNILAVLLFAAMAGTFHSCSDSNSEPVTYFPVLEVSGTHYEIGYAIGTTFKERIGKAFNHMDGLIGKVETFIDTDTERFYTRYVETVQALYPQFIEELQGMADGSGFPFKSFMISSMLPEYIAMMTLGIENPLGCSTVSYKYGGKVYLAHNEDGGYYLHDLMFIVKAHPTGKPSFISFCHPGNSMGPAPAMNDAGIFYSSNFVTGTEFQEGGIPTTFIERSFMEAQTMDEAIRKATIANRAYCFNVNIASRDEAKVVSIEIAPSTYYLHEVEGLFVHTNHFFQPDMEKFTVSNASSKSRFEVLTDLTGAYADRLNEVEGDLLTQFLSSHERSPDSPCSHGGEDVPTSQTLGSTLFDLNNGTWRISFNNPCQKKFQTVGF